MTNLTSPVITPHSVSHDHVGPDESAASGVSWAAVIAGAFVSAALSVILLSLGAGLGLSSVSPWASMGASATALGAASIIWIIAMQVISSGMGGYLAGRLRTKWTAIHDDEVYFRDTAHGFLVWAVGLVLTASFLASATASMVGTSVNSMPSQAPADSTGYMVDTLMRSSQTAVYDAPTHAEAGRILAMALRGKDISAADRTYLGQMVAARTGMNQADSERRVNEVLNDARQALDAARKATAYTLLWLFIALLIGAFCASYAATIGGRQRDHIRTI